MRSGNNVGCNNFTKRVSSCRACLNSSLNSANVTAYHYAYKTGTDLLRTNEYNVSSLNHSISRLDSSYDTSGLYHSKCFHF